MEQNERTYILIARLDGSNISAIPFTAVNNAAAMHFLVDYIDHNDAAENGRLIMDQVELWSEDEGMKIFTTLL